MPGPPSPAVSVIVPARDAEATLPATLVALGAQAGAPEHEVLVVDNGSRDATAALAEEAGARVLRLPRGPGPGVARDAGAHAARAPALAFTDADCAPTPGWLAAGSAALHDAGLVQGAVEPDPSTPMGPFDRSLTVTGPGLFESANLFVRREVHARVGGFGRGLEGPDAAPFGEDVLFGWRVRGQGIPVAFAPDALVHHAVLPRTAWGYIAERRRLGLFCALVARAPGLRGALCWHRLFLTRRQAEVWLALAGAGAAVATRRPTPALAAAPYAHGLLALARGQEGSTARLAAVHAAAHLVGTAALAMGSVRTRTLLL
ncbi:MAG TPA: glycosyltransferase [Solirubrobacteraceae bacterium]|nr:glycosyltransferase [Solirubrobacteraceae bacterium]